jgi:peptidoglycan hydrolase-like protein with peptidoglycan-binding domain
VNKLVTAAREEVTEIPAKYGTVGKRELVTDGYMAWRSILCETNMTRSRITDIQLALKSAGHDIGPDGVDGVIGQDTIKAVNAFQRANDLPVDRYINVQTLKVLGVSPK